MKRTAAVMLTTLALCAAAAAQAPAQGPKRSRPKAAPAAAASKSSAAADEEVERLLDRYVLAQGGAGLLALKTRIMRGGVDMSASPLTGKFESYEKLPKKSLIVVNAPGGQFIEASDGGKKWVKSPWAGVSPAGVVAEDPLSGQGGAGVNGFRWRRLFSAARVKGRASVEGRETVVLAATPVGLEPALFYFDAETGLLVKKVFVRPVVREDEVQAIYIDSYATVDGLKAPVLFRHVYTRFTLTFRVYEVKHNVHIDDALFTAPNGS